MSNWYISSAGYTAVAQWAAGHTYAAGAIVRPLAAPNVGSERCFRTPAGGVSAGSEPVWNLAQGSTQPADNTVTWVECTGAEARQSPGAWTAPAARLNSMTKTAYVSAVAINNSGTGGTYAVNDVLTVAGGTTYGDTCTIKVLTVSAGKLATIAIINGGAFTANPTTTANAVTGGGGTGATINLTMTNWSASTDNFYVAGVTNIHAETQATALTIQSQATTTNSQPTILCVDDSGSGHVPPTSADLKTTATISTTGNSALTLNNLGYVNGITFTAGSGANSVGLSLNSLAGIGRFDNCAMRLGGTSGGNISASNSAGGKTIWDNTTIQVASAGSSITGQTTSSFLWRNTLSAITGATLPTTLFAASQNLAKIVVDGVDLSALGSGKTLVGALSSTAGDVTFIDCTIGASVTVAANAGNIASGRVSLIRCDSGGTNYRHETYPFEGTQTVETTIIRTGGASDGTTGISWKIVTTANVAWFHPFESFQIGEWNSVTGTNRVCTVHGIWNAAALPNNDDIWLDVEYLGSSGSPRASFGSGTKANILASGVAQTADSTSAWDSLVPAWVANTVYTTSSVVSGSSVGNAGRMFFCTSGGTSTNGAAPAGFASAVDGGSVTDNTVTWRAGVRFSMSATLNSPQPQLVGDLYGIVRAAKASTTFYADPLLALS